MSDHNKELIAELREAHLSCNERLNTLQPNGTVSAAELEQVKTDVQRLFEDFHASELWVHPISYPKDELIRLTLELDIAPEHDAQTFLGRTQALMQFLREVVLEEARAWAASAETSDWNMKMLNQLTLTRRYQRQTEKRLEEQGADLDNNAQLQEHKKTFNEQNSVYRAQLRNNVAEANERHLNRIGRVNDLIKEVQSLDKYLVAYAALNTFIGRWIVSSPEKDAA